MPDQSNKVPDQSNKVPDWSNKVPDLSNNVLDPCLLLWHVEWDIMEEEDEESGDWPPGVKQDGRGSEWI